MALVAMICTPLVFNVMFKDDRVNSCQNDGYGSLHRRKLILASRSCELARWRTTIERGDLLSCGMTRVSQREQAESATLKLDTILLTESSALAQKEFFCLFVSQNELALIADATGYTAFNYGCTQDFALYMLIAKLGPATIIWEICQGDFFVAEFDSQNL